MESKKNIWIDGDPGIDDAVALAVAAAHRDRLKICGISAVAGNQTSDRVTENALKLTEFLGMPEVPVVRGARGPLIREIVPAGDVHGKTGLGYCQLPETGKALASENGLLYIRDIICNLPEGEKITILSIGPLTDMALLVKTFPEVTGRIERLVLMGGAAVGGNVTPTAEFNIWEDPEAAKIVFASGLPLVMCGLDLTHQCCLNREQVAALSDGGVVCKAYYEMLRFYFDYAYQDKGAVCIHDAATVIYAMEPELFSGRMRRVEIDCSEGINRGMTICDMREGRSGGENALVLDELRNVERFQNILLDALQMLDRAKDARVK